MQETQEMQVRILGWEDTLEKEMATGSSIVGWRILWTEEPGNYNPWSPKESDMTQHPCMLILQIKRLRTVMLKVTWLELSCHSFHFFFFKSRISLLLPIRLSYVARKIDIIEQRLFLLRLWEPHNKLDGKINHDRKVDLHICRSKQSFG